MRQKKKEKKREFFIKAAKKTFIKRGIVSSNMEDISLKTGTSRTALYYYFKSKEEILKAIILGVKDKILKRLSKGIKDVKSKKDLLNLMIETVFWLHRNDKESMNIVLRLKLKDNESNLPQLKEFLKHVEKKLLREVISLAKEKDVELSEKEIILLLDYLTGLSFFIIIGMPERFLHVMNEAFLKEFSKG